MKARTVFERIFRHPEPLRRFDDYLLKHYPQMWRLRVHYVLIYWLLAGVALFIVGYSMPLDFFRNNNDPNLYLISKFILCSCTAMIGLLSFFTWRDKLSGIQQKNNLRWYVTLLEIFLYAICIIAILFSVMAYKYGLDLKEYEIRNKAKSIYHSSFLRSHNYFYPAYIPHFDTTKNALADVYFNRGEQLYGILLQRQQMPDDTIYLPLKGSWDNDRSETMLEAEAMTQIGYHFTMEQVVSAWDSIRLWGYMPYSLRNDFEKNIEALPYLLAGLSYEEGLRFLEQHRDTFNLSEVDVRQIGKHYPAGKHTHFSIDTIVAGQTYRFKYQPGISIGKEKFYYKCFVESLDATENKAYNTYLSELRNEKMPDMENGVYEIFRKNSNKKIQLINFFSRHEGDQDRDIVKCLPFIEEFVTHLDSSSGTWYEKFITVDRPFGTFYDGGYTDKSGRSGPIIISNFSMQYYKNLVRKHSLQRGDSADQSRVQQYKLFAQRKQSWSKILRTEHPKNTDSLLFYYPDHAQLYLEDVSHFFYDRYLDYYLKKHSISELDTLRSLMLELGYNTYPAGSDIDDNARKTILSDAFDLSVDLQNTLYINHPIEHPFNRSFWIKLAGMATYLAVLFFFFCNTNVVVIMRSFFITIILFAIATLLIYLFREDADGSSSQVFQKIFRFYVSGISAIVTIVLLVALRFRMPALAMLVQIQILLSLFIPLVIFVDTEYSEGWLATVFILAYWCFLLITIAILYRRHQTLPEKA